MTSTLPPDHRDRALGSLLGLAVGDALGTTIEFSPRDTKPSVIDMVSGGVFGLAAGQWTDDTSMALCLAEALIEGDGSLDEADLMRLAPVAILALPDIDRAGDLSHARSRTTHAAPIAHEACPLFATLLVEAMSRMSRDQVLRPPPSRIASSNPIPSPST